MPILVTPADVTVFGELTRRLKTSAAATGQVAADLGGLLAGVPWTGVAATAGHDETHRLAHRLRVASDTLGALSARAARTMQTLAEQLAHRQAYEASLLHELDRVVRLPGDLEDQGRHLVRELHLGRALRSVLP